MAGDVPPDFDADWYAANYPDVGLSGLSPREHYRLFGSVFGRKHKGSGAMTAPAAAPRPAPKGKRADASPAERKVAPPPLPPSSVEQQPIIDRPDGFDPATSVPDPAPPKAGSGPDQAFHLDNIATVAGASGRSRPAITQPLRAYARLLDLDADIRGAGAAGMSCGADPFTRGRTRIDNAWLVDQRRLRLMFADGEVGPGVSRWAIRAYQADPASPADLRILGQGVKLPPQGPAIHDLELVHPLMPLLLELSDAEGMSQAFALLPFPSLLPGGLHSAELRALQTEPNPMDDFWALSEALLEEAVGGDGWPDRSVSSISAPGEPATGHETASTRSVHEWLACVFGVEIGPPGPRKDGLQLVFPPDCVPTVSALVSRRLNLADNRVMSGPYLVTEANNYRPRWSIALPPGDDFGSAVPVVRRGEGIDASSEAQGAPVPLAIAIRTPTTFPSAGPQADIRAVGPGPLSILVSASDASRTERLVHSIRSAVGGEIEWLVSLDSDDAEVGVDRACGAGAWTQVPPRPDLRQVARNAQHEILLTVSDRVNLADGGALFAVLGLLEREETTGSASCALLAEKTIKKEVMLQAASGGLFPTAVSLVSGPRLSFGEPDVLQALPDLDYPVAANTMLMTAWRRSALTALPPVPGSGAPNAEDIRLGLDLMRAGYRNWCTTRATASLAGPYAPRDAIDPVGAGYLHPAGWQEILSRVALVRELF